MKKMMMAAIVVCLLATSAKAGQLRLAGYYDVSREQRTITVDGFSQLSTKWSTWGFVDFYTTQGNQKDAADNADVQTFCGKGTLSFVLWQIDQHNSVKLTGELIDSSWASSEFRPGLQWVVGGDWGFANFKVLPVTFELVAPEDPLPQVGAIGGAWYVNASDKMFWEGFWEMTYTYEDQTRYYPVIGETQLGYRLTEKLNILVEYRYNNFVEDDHGLGLGAEIVF
ncbi:MAG: hypothetical protein NTZ49_01270 [Candidatus Parcubacteria bacterium]|nr:hypothetical protein [Candidatus Parcubacteria bacterium]